MDIRPASPTTSQDFALNLRRLRGENRRPGGKSAKITFVAGAEHNHYVRRARDEARESVVVASHRLSDAGRTSVVVPMVVAAENSDVKVDLYYGRLSGGMNAKMVEVLARESQGVALNRVDRVRLHAKVLVWGRR